MDIRLSDYAITPLYNIKAVVQTTQVSPSTLRAWERRYNVCRPQRSDSGYRLYSDQDIAIIQWLKAQIEVGMSISQAVAWLENLAKEANGLEQAVLPNSNNNFSNYGQTSVQTAQQTTSAIVSNQAVRSFGILQQELLSALTSYNDQTSEQIISEAFSLYTVEQVGEGLFLPVLVEIGRRWHQGTLSIVCEHYGTNYLFHRLIVLLRTIPNNSQGPLIWVSCAPTETHEIGPILLSIYLRRSGYRVCYLGQNIPTNDFLKEAKRQQPDVILLSATTITAIPSLQELTTKLAHLRISGLLVGYGGQIFNKQPDLCHKIDAADFMGGSAKEAVERLKQLLESPKQKYSGQKEIY